jgi:hypothetical protein
LDKNAKKTKLSPRLTAEVATKITPTVSALPSEVKAAQAAEAAPTKPKSKRLARGPASHVTRRIEGLDRRQVPIEAFDVDGSELAGATLCQS